MPERKAPDECLQLKTGSCLGCPVLYTIYQEVRLQPVTADQAGRRIGRQLCPSNARPQLHHITQKGNLHSFGQPREIEKTS